MYSSLIVKKVQVVFFFSFFRLTADFSLICQTYPLPHFLPKGLKTGFPEACLPVTSDLFCDWGGV